MKKISKFIIFLLIVIVLFIVHNKEAYAYDEFEKKY